MMDADQDTAKFPIPGEGNSGRRSGGAL